MRALSASVAGITDRARKGHGSLCPKFARGGFDEVSDFPMAGVVAKRDGLAIGCAQSALGAEDEELRAGGERCLPAHSDILRKSKQVAARGGGEHLRGQREGS